MQNQRKYILKGGVKNPSWELRNHSVMVKKSDKEGLREIQYVPGADSIWKEENKKQGTAKSRWFTNGALLVDNDDKVQIKYLESHPDYNVKFELFDPEAKAEEKYNQLELIEKAKEMLRKNVDDEDKMAATAASLFGQTSMAWGAKQTKLRCFTYADQKPEKVISALNDPAVEAKYIAALGLRKRIVKANPQRTAVVWNDDDAGVIVQVATGKQPLEVLGDFLFNEDNVTTLQEIGKRLEELDGGTSKKKKPVKKADDK